MSSFENNESSQSTKSKKKVAKKILKNTDSNILPKFPDKENSSIDNSTQKRSISNNKNKDQKRLPKKDNKDILLNKITKSHIIKNQNKLNSKYKTDISELDKLIEKKNKYRKFYSHSVKIDYVPLSPAKKKLKFDGINKYSCERFKKYNTIFDQIKEQILDINKSYNTLIEYSRTISCCRPLSSKVINKFLIEDYGNFSPFKKTGFDTKEEFTIINEDIKEENDSILFETQDKKNDSDNVNCNESKNSESKTNINTNKTINKEKKTNGTRINQKVNASLKNKTINKSINRNKIKINNDRKQIKKITLNIKKEENTNTSINSNQEERKECIHILKNTNNSDIHKKIEKIRHLPNKYSDINEKSREKASVCHKILKGRTPKNPQTDYSTEITQTESKMQTLNNCTAYRESKTTHLFYGGYEGEKSECKCVIF